MNLGDFPEDFATVTCMFTTHASDGSPVAPSTALEAADVLIYKNGNAAQKTTTNGVTMTSPFDSLAGLHCLVIDTSNDTGDAGFWTAGAQYTLVLSPDETVDTYVVRKVLATFGIELSEVLRPTTAGRQLDVSAGGEAGIDWANIGSPTTAQTLSGTTVKTATDVETDTQDIQSRLPAALVSGRMDSSTGAMAANVMTAAAAAADLTTELQTGLATAAALSTLQTTANGIKTKTDSLTFTVAGVIDAAVTHWVATAVAAPDTAGYPVTTIKDGTGQGEINTSGGRVSADVARWLGTAVATPTVAGVPQVEVIDMSAAGQADVRAAVGLAAADLDTQLTALPTNAELATALSTADDAVLTQIALVKAKTDGLTFTVAGVLDANIQYVNDVLITGNGQAGTEWGP